MLTVRDNGLICQSKIHSRLTFTQPTLALNQRLFEKKKLPNTVPTSPYFLKGVICIACWSKIRSVFEISALTQYFVACT